jgi:hypothetical protein
VGFEHLKLCSGRAVLFKVGEGHAHSVREHFELGSDRAVFLVEFDPVALGEDFEVSVEELFFKERLERIVICCLVEHKEEDNPVDDDVLGGLVNLNDGHVACDELLAHFHDERAGEEAVLYELVDINAVMFQEVCHDQIEGAVSFINQLGEMVMTCWDLGDFS